MMFDFMMREYPQNGSPAGITMEDDADPEAAPSELTKLEHLQQEDASILAFCASCSVCRPYPML